MGQGYGDGPTCIYDMIPCDGCRGCCKSEFDSTPLDNYYEEEE